MVKSDATSWHRLRSFVLINEYIVVCTRATYPILLRLVRGLVKFVEQEQEHKGVHADPPDERSRIITFDEEQLECVYHDGDKLHLKLHRTTIYIN